MSAKDPRTYIRVHDGIADHPKIVGLSPAAKWLMIELWCYCSRHHTDGLVATAAGTRYGSTALLRELVDGDVLTVVPGGWQCHDYLQHQYSREEIAERRATRAASGALGGRAKANRLASATANGVASATAAAKQTASERASNGVAPEQQTSSYVDVDEVQEQNTPSPPARVRAILPKNLTALFDEFWTAYPRKVGKLDAQRKFAAAVKDGTDPSIVIAGAQLYAESAAGSEERFIAHPATWLHQGRWTDEPVVDSTPPWGVTTGNEAWMNV